MNSLASFMGAILLFGALAFSRALARFLNALVWKKWFARNLPGIPFSAYDEEIYLPARVRSGYWPGLLIFPLPAAAGLALWSWDSVLGGLLCGSAGVLTIGSFWAYARRDHELFDVLGISTIRQKAVVEQWAKRSIQLIEKRTGHEGKGMERLRDYRRYWHAMLRLLLLPPEDILKKSSAANSDPGAFKDAPAVLDQVADELSLIRTSAEERSHLQQEANDALRRVDARRQMVSALLAS